MVWTLHFLETWVSSTENQRHPDVITLSEEKKEGSQVALGSVSLVPSMKENFSCHPILVKPESY